MKVSQKIRYFAKKLIIMSIADKIKAARTFVRLSQAEVARRMDISPEFYHKLEKRGEKLSIEQVEKIASALGMSYIELLTYGESAPEDKHTDTTELTKRIQELESRIKDKEEIIENLRDKVDAYEKATWRVSFEILSSALYETAEQHRMGKFCLMSNDWLPEDEGIDWEGTYDEMRKKYPDRELYLDKEVRRELIKIILDSELKYYVGPLISHGLIHGSDDWEMWGEENNKRYRTTEQYMSFEDQLKLYGKNF